MTVATPELTREALLESPSALRSYLENKLEGAVVGYSCDPHRCPAATFLSEMGLGRVDSAVAPYEPGRKKTEPAWLIHFVNAVDGLHRTVNAPVSREEALAVLDDIEV